jgi:hypothetical protein
MHPRRHPEERRDEGSQPCRRATPFRCAEDETTLKPSSAGVAEVSPARKGWEIEDALAKFPFARFLCEPSYSEPRRHTAPLQPAALMPHPLMCRTYGARRVVGFLVPALRAGLNCAAPTALERAA